MLNWLLRPLGYNRHMPVEPSNETLYTITEAARVLDMSRQRVHQLIKSGRIKAQDYGRLWLIPQSELDNAARTYKKHRKQKR